VTFSALTHLECSRTGVIDTVGPDEHGWCWAEQVRTALLELKSLIERAVAEEMSAVDPTLLARHTGYPISCAHRGRY
jgi:hypothetical protein